MNTLEAKMSNDELVERIIAGDNEAFGEYVSANKWKLYSTIQHMVRNQDDAKDLLQDTIIKAHRALPGFKQKSQLQTWLYTIAVNTTINFLRKRNRTYSHSLNDEDDNITLTREFIERTSTHDASYDLMKREQYAELHLAISKLKETHRQIIQWIDIEGRKHTDISKQLGIPVGTVRSRLHYAHKQLKKVLVNG